jgi:hypothetical protein
MESGLLLSSARWSKKPTSKPTEPWQIAVDNPGWLASVSGHTGFHGVNPYVDVGFGSLYGTLTRFMPLKPRLERDGLVSLEMFSI